MQNYWIKGFVVTVMLSIFILTPAMAQVQQGGGDEDVNYSNEELKTFLMANAGIYQVQQQVAAQMQNLESEQEKQALIQTANQQMVQVLDDVGLTADEYNAMGQTIQSDTQLQEKINTIASDMFPEEKQQ